MKCQWISSGDDHGKVDICRLVDHTTFIAKVQKQSRPTSEILRTVLIPTRYTKI